MDVKLLIIRKGEILIMNGTKKVLVVDNDVKVRNVFSMYLKKEGYDVLETGNGLDALSITEKEKPDLIILDIMLPDLSGYEVFKKIKSNKGTKNTIIIILSTIDKDLERFEQYKEKAYLYVRKPISPKRLIKNVKEIIN